MYLCIAGAMIKKDEAALKEDKNGNKKWILRLCTNKEVSAKEFWKRKRG